MDDINLIDQIKFTDEEQKYMKKLEKMKKKYAKDVVKHIMSAPPNVRRALAWDAENVRYHLYHEINVTDAKSVTWDGW